MSESEKNKKGQFFKSLFSFVGAVTLLLSVRWLLVEPYVIPSGSMLPTLLIHDHILVNKFAFGIRKPFTKEWLIQFDPPQRGEIVVFRSIESDNHFIIKRVIGLAGDEISYTSKGEILINGKKVERTELKDPKDEQKPFYYVDSTDIGGEFSNFVFYNENIEKNSYRTMLSSDAFRFDWEEKPFKVKEGHIFVMGDNRDNSRDSRSWGSLPVENLLGKAMFVWLSCQNTLSFAPFLCDPLEVRWNRFFHGIK